MEKKSRIKRFGVSMEEEILKEFDRIIEKIGYKTRSEAIKDLVRKKILEEKVKEGKEEVIGILGIIYNHEVREVEDKLTSFEHKNYKKILTNSHIHLDKKNCLEVKVLKGKIEKIKKISEKIISTRGVKYGEIIFLKAE